MVYVAGLNAPDGAGCSLTQALFPDQLPYGLMS